jgi:hypothetical protein
VCVGRGADGSVDEMDVDQFVLYGVELIKVVRSDQDAESIE